MYHSPFPKISFQKFDSNTEAIANLIRNFDILIKEANCFFKWFFFGLFVQTANIEKRYIFFNVVLFTNKLDNSQDRPSSCLFLHALVMHAALFGGPLTIQILRKLLENLGTSPRVFCDQEIFVFEDEFNIYLILLSTPFTL